VFEHILGTHIALHCIPLLLSQPLVCIVQIHLLLFRGRCLVATGNCDSIVLALSDYAAIINS
jgi:hypothetical protein